MHQTPITLHRPHLNDSCSALPCVRLARLRQASADGSLARLCDGIAVRSAVFGLPATARTARLVRRWATDLLAVWELPVDDAATVIAELAANAAEHGGAVMTVGLHHCPDSLAIEVADSGTGKPLPLLPFGNDRTGIYEVRGRGLLMVAALADYVHLCRSTDGSTRALAVLPLSTGEGCPAVDGQQSASTSALSAVVTPASYADFPMEPAAPAFPNLEIRPSQRPVSETPHRQVS